MNDENPSKLESLPDELLTDLFGYFNISDLFQSFDHLNARFNTLLESLDHLQLNISQDNYSIDLHRCSSLVHCLILIGEVDINLQDFQNVRRLVLHSPTENFLQQLLHVNILPRLESLSIPDTLFGMSPIHQRIFSNAFPHLQFTHLFGFETIETIRPWTQTTSLRILKIGFVDFHAYKSILCACPNLYHLKLSLFQSYLKLTHIQSHRKLRKLEIHSETSDCRYDDQLIDSFLGCVSNLEYLTIYRSISVSKIRELLPDYNWFSSIIAIRLPSLQYFILYLHLEYQWEFLDVETRRQLRKLFLNAHQNRYQARFVLQ